MAESFLTEITDDELCMLCGDKTSPNGLTMQAYANGKKVVSFKLCDKHSKDVGEYMMTISPLAQLLKMGGAFGGWK